MSTREDLMDAGLIGARAGLKTLDRLLGEFAAVRPDVPPDAALFSLNDVRRIIAVACESIPEFDAAPALEVEAIGSRNTETLQREAPHLLAPDEQLEGGGVDAA